MILDPMERRTGEDDIEFLEVCGVEDVKQTELETANVHDFIMERAMAMHSRWPINCRLPRWASRVPSGTRHPARSAYPGARCGHLRSRHQGTRAPGSDQTDRRPHHEAPSRTVWLHCAAPTSEELTRLTGIRSACPRLRPGIGTGPAGTEAPPSRRSGTSGGSLPCARALRRCRPHNARGRAGIRARTARQWLPLRRRSPGCASRPRPRASMPAAPR